MKNAAEPGVSDVNNVPVCCCLVKEDCITVLRTLGIGEFGVIQHAVWTKDTGQQVCLSVSALFCMLLDLLCVLICKLFEHVSEVVGNSCLG